MKLSKQDKADIAFVKVASRVAIKLGHGYRLIGIGPGALFSSNRYSRFSLDMPESLVRFLDTQLANQKVGPL